MHTEEVTTDLIIPHFGASAALNRLALACLTSIRRHTKGYRLIWIDNGSPVQDAKLDAELHDHPGITLHNAENLGFVKAINQGIRQASAPFVVIMNNDTQAVDGWLEKLREPFDNPRVAITGPLMGIGTASWQARFPQADGSPVTLREGGMLAFFCAMFRREVFYIVGALDESYGLGLGDDDNYCMRVQDAGFDLVLVRSLRIPHHHRSTFKTMFSGQEVIQMQTAAGLKFRREQRNRKRPGRVPGSHVDTIKAE